MEENINNTIEETIASAPACGTKKKCSCTCIMNTLTLVLLAAVVVLFILFFTSKGTSKVNPDAKDVVVPDGGLKIAYVNTDTLMANYQYAIDLTKELEEYSKAKMSSAQQQMASFQKDYENYLKEGPNMTLTQQKAKEQELQSRADKMKTLEQEVAMQIQEKTMKESEKMTNAVYAFIREYNEANQQFNLILARSFSSSPVLYGDEGLDITDEILKGLNEEYAKVKSDK